MVDISGLNPDIQNKSGNVSFHQYADDTQLYIGANSSKLAAEIASIESCTQRSMVNGLHLNPSKSEAIAFSKPRSKPLVALALASHAWNKLAAHVSSASTLPVFRRRLKHHFFLDAYPGFAAPTIKSEGITSST